MRRIEPERAKEQERRVSGRRGDRFDPPRDPIRGQLALRARIRDALAAADVPLLRRLRTELDNITRALTGFARGYGFRVCWEE